LFVETGIPSNRDQLLAAVIKNLKKLYQELTAAGGDAQASGLREAILKISATVGQQVSVEFPDGKKAFGKAQDIDTAGRLVLETSSETLTVSAGDVLHLRKA
jgi:BirA family biotin operon repressor/biotin-[acetyl-CoA-carboxylase] ligase